MNLSERLVPTGPLAQLARQIAPGYELRPAWRIGDPEIEAGAIDFWRRLDLLPPGVSAQERAKDLVVAAFKDGRVVGVSSAQIGLLEQVRAYTAMLRGAVDPEHRRFYVGRAMLLYAREILEAWAIANPEAKLAGLSAVLEAELGDRQKQPFAPLTSFGVIGFTPDGCQIRVSWFDHFRYD